MEKTFEVFADEREKSRVAIFGGEQILLETIDDAIDIISKAGEVRARKIIIPRAIIHPDFFLLKTRVAGETLQKFTQYIQAVAITGDFSDTDKNFKAFMIESNKGSQVFFCPSIRDALDRLHMV